jgi:nucleoside-diphosphate-sugar epimerase
VVRLLTESKHTVIAGVRRHSNLVPPNASEALLGDINAETNWRPVLEGIECVVHCAATAHVLRPAGRDGMLEFHKADVTGARQLAEEAASASVKRMMFISSVKVNGEQTALGVPYRESDDPAPEDDYGRCKWQAEQNLLEIAAKTGLDLVIVRPPLVYGPGVGANFLRLLRLVERGWPLPFGAINNSRSFVALDNLVDLLIRCVDHPAAAGQTFLVSDDHDLSTPALVRAMASAFGRRPRLLPVPVLLLRVAGTLTGRPSEMQRLTQSLQVDIRHTKNTLDWMPPIGFEEALAETVAAFQSTRALHGSRVYKKS